MRLMTLFALLVVTGTGCATAHFYPVAGPLATPTPGTPVSVLKAKVKNVTSNSGGLSMTLETGEKCSGRWSSIAPTTMGAMSTQLSDAWSTVYGTTYYSANVAGINHGEAVMTCDKGTVVQAEFATGSGTAHGTGVAKDNRGNVWKVLF